MRFGGFDWDRGNRAKCERHGVRDRDIEDVFDRPVAVVPDPRHSSEEERFKAIGTTGQGPHVLIVFTLRRHPDALLVKPISARLMHRKEIAHDEEAIASAQNR